MKKDLIFQRKDAIILKCMNKNVISVLSGENRTLSAEALCTVPVTQIYKEIEMANIKSAKKRILVNRTKALRNQMLKSQLKTIIKKFNAAVESGDKAVATELFRLTVKKVDQAVAQGILHRNNAAHKKSEFALKLNRMA